jgi:hypothetical protein
VQKTAGDFGLQIQVLNASNSREIDAAFPAISRERAEALFVAPRRLLRQPPCAVCHLGGTRSDSRDLFPAHLCRRVGGLMSYGTILRKFSSGRRLCWLDPERSKAGRAASHPVDQVRVLINLQTARALGLQVPSGLLLAADEVIE